jgi:hypothetical protein
LLYLRTTLNRYSKQQATVILRQVHDRAREAVHYDAVACQLCQTRGYQIAHLEFRLVACWPSKNKRRHSVVNIPFVVNPKAIFRTWAFHGQQLHPEATLPEK